ncbi:methyltransferase domain-containing protein [Streptomyces corynorhini]|uniref:Protein-L-isoaspartate O-methyltransferase n=1 Tax=Streptomyces corynorhini TaxID=2282652 RepID=A0A370B5P5_9ACTN|nr:methyltransferase domain-containing protein [Streptomyces corynorhini]
MRSVPRELFLPDLIEAEGRLISRGESPDAWLAAVYDDLPLITQVNDGRSLPEGAYQLPTASSSMPTVMLEMLDLLAVQKGQRVLELGAATGYNAAWLAHGVGSSGAVTTLDIDPVLVEQAAKNLTAAGLAARVVCGLGEAGLPEAAPYDRVIATYTVPAIPYAWIEQAPAGRIVAPWGGSFFSHSFAVLDVADGEAHGGFTGYPAFMRSRHGRPDRGYLVDFLHHRDKAVTSRTVLSPLAFDGDGDALFFIGLDLPDAWYLRADADDDSGEATFSIFADDRTSWAAADYVPDADDYVITQYGPRSLWDEAERSYRTWERRGRPERDRAGLSVTPDGQNVWLDAPENVVFRQSSQDTS